MKTLLLSAIFSFSIIYTHAQIITTIAGDGGTGYSPDSISALSANIPQPIGIVLDDMGNMYISDRANRLLEVNTSGLVFTIAGTGIAGFSGDDSLAINANIDQPYGVVVDGSGNVYFADGNNSRVRKISTSGIITTVAGIGSSTIMGSGSGNGYNGDNIPATAAELNYPAGIVLDGGGNLYIADYNNNRIRKVNTSGIITTIAGTGAASDSIISTLATATSINHPYGITLDAEGNIYFTEVDGNVIRKIGTSGAIFTIAGTDTAGFTGNGGPATTAQIKNPLGITIDIDGDIFFSDEGNDVIRKINPSGIITTYAGTGTIGFSGDGGSALDAEIFEPAFITLDDAANLYIADGGNNRVRHIISTVSVNTVSTPTDKLIVYPNPTQGNFTINIASTFDEQDYVSITNIAGEKVKELTITTNKPLNVKLDERAGLYFVTVTTPSGVYNAKLVII